MPVEEAIRKKVKTRMTMTLKRCTIADLDTVRDVSARTFTQTFAAQNTADDIDAYIAESFARETLAAQLTEPQTLFFLVCVDEDVAGYLKLNLGGAQTENRGGNAMEVERIYTLARFKRQGLGTVMMKRAVEEATTRGLATVWLGVWEHNHPARRFYESLGFSVCGSHVFTLGSDEQTDLLMELKI